uniref:Glucuronosyltransferase n=1 Tax=Panagrolaimus sp. ES5 TaxID=591445 RepID=A0AC34G089_9BILA
MMSNGRIADVLVEAGHDVTFLSVEGFLSTADFPTTKLAKVVTIGRIPDDRKALWQKVKGSATEAAFQKRGIFDSAKTFPQFASAISSFVEQHITKLFGIPNPTGWVPSVGALSISDKMSFIERAQNELEHIILTKGYSMLFASATDTFQKYYGPSFPDVKDIMKEKVPLSFVAADEFMEFPRPLFHNLVYIGGLGMKSSKNVTLNEPFESEMAKGKKGVVFFSLGSNVDSTNVPEIVKKNLLDGFAQFSDYHFIIKLEATDVYGINYAKTKSNIFITNWAPQATLLQHPRMRLFVTHATDVYGINYAKTKSNIFITNWAPQATLLQHPRMKLFVTHGGYNSLLEVARSGVPVLLMPMMYDQTRNGQIVQRNGWGKVMDKMELLNGNNKLVSHLEEMLTQEK